ncbi:MAG: hypothetical protein IKM73_00210 [Acidaminococcaceae bacterium]|nr:hypothetical protein [Acidaminococcaceae bacterium]
MELLIKIPKEFEQHFKQDAFEDSLHRLSADAHLIAGLYEQETAAMLIESLKNAVPIPAHGKLVDADRILSEQMKRKYYHLPNGDTAIPVIDVEHAPTVIPADPAEEGET